jgi:hypothetical protein
MQFTDGLSGEAAALARTHAQALDRLPATIQAFILIELHKWPGLFPPEQRYQRSLLAHVSQLSGAGLSEAVSGVARIETEAGCDRLARRDPSRFQEEAQALLRRRQLVPAWRREVDNFFRRIDPAIEAQLFPADAPRRLIVQLYGSGIAIQPDKLWSRFQGTGTRVPLQLDGVQGGDGFLRALFGHRDGRTGLPLLEAAEGASGITSLDRWIIEAQDSLHRLWDDGASTRTAGGAVTGLSYERLREYRDGLTKALYTKIQSGVDSPQAFASYARSLKITPGPGVLTNPADLLLSFVRDVLLTGNGTLFVNNTFVEWAAVQALRRAQPRILVARFGVRDKLKPFSSLLLFSQPRPSDQIPLIEDPVGSFVDVEQLAYYIWLNAEKSPAYRKKTLHLLLAEGFDEMLAIRSDAPAAAAALPAASLADVCATMAEWVGVRMPQATGRVIAPLVS